MSVELPDFREYPFFRKLTELTFVDAIYVYGSYANNDSDVRSNINLAILCPEAIDNEWRLVTQIVNNAEPMVTVEVIRWDKTPIGSPFQAQIDRNKMPIFIREDASIQAELHEIYGLLHWHIKLVRDVRDLTQGTPVERQAMQSEHFQKAVHYFWRMARRALILYGLRTHAPLSTLKHAYMEGWLEDRSLWEKLFYHWKRLVPLGDAQSLAQLEAAIPAYLGALEQASTTIRKAIDEAKLPRTVTTQ